MDDTPEDIRNMMGDGPTEAEEQARKKAMTTEEALKELISRDYEKMEEAEVADRFVDLLIDLIAERSEEKAEEVVDQHERDYDHNLR